MNTVAVLKLTLHHAVIGYLAGFQSGKNILVFTNSFRFDQQRPPLSLLTSPLYPQADKILEIPMSGEKESLNVGVAMGIVMFGVKYGHK